MPSSIYDNLPVIIKEIMVTKPNSILDIGIGFGKMGHLCREYLEVWNSRYKKEDWKLKIDGIEIFKDYVNPATIFYYDDIFIGDATKILPYLDSYDLIIANDVIEHIEKSAAENLLKMIIQKSSKKIIMSIPLGDNWLGANGAYAKINPAEMHISSWTIEELKSLDNFSTLYEFCGVRGRIGLFVYEKK